MAKYQGHPSKAFWNVALWLNNDFGLYSMTKDAIEVANNREEAARVIFKTLQTDQGKDVPVTPDGFNYSKSAILAAIRGR
jgi:hypothetical protein